MHMRHYKVQHICRGKMAKKLKNSFFSLMKSAQKGYSPPPYVHLCSRGVEIILNNSRGRQAEGIIKNCFNNE